MRLGGAFAVCSVNLGEGPGERGEGEHSPERGLVVAKQQECRQDDQHDASCRQPFSSQAEISSHGEKIVETTQAQFQRTRLSMAADEEYIIHTLSAVDKLSTRDAVWGSGVGQIGIYYRAQLDAS